MATNYLRDELRVHRIVHLLEWTPKRRKPILNGSNASDCEALIERYPGAQKGL
jgi:hypothetical protein